MSEMLPPLAETPSLDCVRCPHCDTEKLAVTYKAGYRACWACGAELADNFPDEAVWEFRSNPYGWTRRPDPIDKNLARRSLDSE